MLDNPLVVLLAGVVIGIAIGAVALAIERRRRMIFRVQDDPLADIFDIGEERYRRGPDR